MNLKNKNGSIIITIVIIIAMVIVLAIYITKENSKRLQILQPGNCIAFGVAFNIPMLVKMELPDPKPSSESVEIEKVWFVKK